MIKNITNRIATPLVVARNDRSHVSLRGSVASKQSPGVSNGLLNFGRSDKKFTPMRVLE